MRKSYKMLHCILMWIFFFNFLLDFIIKEYHWWFSFVGLHVLGSLPSLHNLLRGWTCRMFYRWACLTYFCSDALSLSHSYPCVNVHVCLCVHTCTRILWMCVCLECVVVHACMHCVFISCVLYLYWCLYHLSFSILQTDMVYELLRTSTEYVANLASFFHTYIFYNTRSLLLIKFRFPNINNWHE